MTVFTSAPAVASPAPMDPDAYAMAASTRSLIRWGATRLPRARQKAIGASEVGHPCDRRITYKMSGQTGVNVPDPLRALVGIGWHRAMDDVFVRLNGDTGRFLVEQPVQYRGIPGTVDMYDSLEGVVYDWKTTTKAKLSKVRSGGPQPSYVTQVSIYAAALAELGFPVKLVALVFVPVDGRLDDLWVWRRPYDKSVADLAIDRIEHLAKVRPDEAVPSPDPLCTWCPYYNAESTDPLMACNATV